MKKKLLLVFLFIVTILSAQQNQIPVVGNVHFSQRIDGSFWWISTTTYLTTTVTLHW